MKKGIKAFFKYARARHQIHLDRVAGKPRPWTKDPILDTYRFTNVFRELDKTTKWFADHVRTPLRQTAEVLPATVIFRLLNRIEVGEAIFCQTDIEHENAFDHYMATGDVRVLRRAIIANCGKGPYVTGAYIISSPPGYSKLDGVLRIIGGFYKNSGWRHWTDNDPAGNECSLQAAWEFLKEQPYFGPFHSYEMVTDLRFTSLLEDAPDVMSWCNVGPGARRGLNRVMGRDKEDHTLTTEEMLEEMRELLAHSRDPDLWPRCKIDTAKMWMYDHEWPTWEMRDVEHTLCEFDKFERVRLGEGRPRGVYR